MGVEKNHSSVGPPEKGSGWKEKQDLGNIIFKIVETSVCLKAYRIVPREKMTIYSTVNLLRR